jgi:hypothetical protein
MDGESPGELAKVCIGEVAPDIHPSLLLKYRILESNHTPMYPGFPPCESVETHLQGNYFMWFCVPHLSEHRGNDYLQSGRSGLNSWSRVRLKNPMRR